MLFISETELFFYSSKQEFRCRGSYLPTVWVACPSSVSRLQSIYSYSNSIGIASPGNTTAFSKVMYINANFKEKDQLHVQVVHAITLCIIHFILTNSSSILWQTCKFKYFCSLKFSETALERISIRRPHLKSPLLLLTSVPYMLFIISELVFILVIIIIIPVSYLF